MAVCLLPGTEVAFEKEVQYERFFVLFPSLKFGTLGKKVRQFRQINIGKPGVHHDALEFPDGEFVLLTGCAKASTRPCCSCRLLRAL